MLNIELIKKIDYYVGKNLIKILSKLKKPEKDSNPKKILLIKFFGFGNIIFLSPSFSYLKKKFPDAEIHFLTLKNNEQILERFVSQELIDKGIYFKFNMLDLSIKTILLLIKLIKEKYDLLIDYDQFSRFSALVSLLCFPKKSVSFDTKGSHRKEAYHRTKEYKGDKNIVEEFFELTLFAIGEEEISKEIKLIKIKEDKTIKRKIEKWLRMKEINPKSDLIIGIHTGTSENLPHLRKWPHFEYLAIKILEEYPSSKIIFTAGPMEKEEVGILMRKIIENFPQYNGRIFSSYGIRLKELPELMNYFDLFISNDTGPLHLAAAQGVPTIGIYGPSDIKVYGAYSSKAINLSKNLKCSPCITNFNNKTSRCKNNLCMKMIMPYEVMNYVKEIIRNLG